MVEYIKAMLVRMLRFSQPLTGTDMVYLVRGGFWLTLGQGWAALGAFALSLIAARYLTPEVFGTYRYLLSLAAIAGALSLTGLGTSIVQSIARGFEGDLARGFRQSLLWSIPGVLVVVGAAGYYAWQGNLIFGFALFFAAIATPLTSAAALYSAYLNGTKDFARQSIYWIAGNMCNVGAMMAAMLLSDNVSILVGTYVFSQMIANVLLYRRTRRLVRNDRSDGASSGFAIHMSAINLLNTIASQIDRVLVFQLLGPAQLAIYTFANAIPEQARGLVKAGARLALPKFAQRPLAEIQTTISRRILVFGVIILAGCAVYAFAAPYLFAILFPAYVASVSYSQVIAFSLVFALGSVLLSALHAHAKVPELYAHAAVTSVTQIISSGIFITVWGLWGAVAALFVNRALGLLMPLVLVWHARESTPPRIDN